MRSAPSVHKRKEAFYQQSKKNLIINICEIINGMSQKIHRKNPGLREISLKQRSGLVVELVGPISNDKRTTSYRWTFELVFKGWKQITCTFQYLIILIDIITLQTDTVGELAICNLTKGNKIRKSKWKKYLCRFG